jgi:hypothetical protein
MTGKIQGEGDYKAARRFNKREQEFVRRKFGKQRVVADFDTTQSDVSHADRMDDPAAGATARDDEDYLRRQGFDLPQRSE